VIIIQKVLLMHTKMLMLSIDIKGGLWYNIVVENCFVPMDGKEEKMNMKKILAALFAGVVGSAMLGIGAMAANVATADELFEAVLDGGKIVLTEDIEYDETLTVEKNTDITIDFNGKTLTYIGTSGYALYNYGDLILKDTSDVPGGIVSTANGSYAFRSASGDVTIEDISILGHSGCLNLRGDNIVINSGNFDAVGKPATTGHIVFVSNCASVTINGGTFGEGDSVADSGCTIVTMSNGANVLINGGEFYQNLAYTVDNWGGNIVILGGTYEAASLTPNGYPASAIPDNVTVEKDENGNNVIVADETQTVAAMIGATTFETFEDAFASAKAGDTIKVFPGKHSAAPFINATNEAGYPDNLNIVGMGDDVKFVLTDADISYNHPSARQYHIGGGWKAPKLTKIAFRNLEFYLEADENASLAAETVDELYIYADTAVFTGCEFDNVNVSPAGATKVSIEYCDFANISGRSAVHFAKTAEIVINNCNFTECASGIHVVSDPLTTFTVTGNTFEGLADGSAAIYFGTEGGDYSAVNLNVSENTAEGQALVRNRNASITLTQIEALSDEEANVFGTAFTANDSDVKFVATIDGVKGYTTLDAAIAEADGAKITLLADAELNTKLNNDTINIDLNGYTMFVNVGANYIIGDNSISGGTVDISKASSSQNIFGLAQYATPATTLTMDKVNFVGNGYNSGYGVFEIGNSGADVSLTITDSTIDLKNDNADQGGFVKGYGANCVLVIEDTDVTLDNTDMFNVNVSANIKDSELTITNLSDTAFRNLGGTIDNTVISVTNSGNGIRNTSTGYNLDVTNNSSIKISGSTNTEEGKVGDLVLAAGNKVNTDTTSELLVETSAIADWDDISGNVVSKADTIYIQYRRTDVERNDDGTIKTESDGDIIDTLEGADTYEIILAGYNSEKINELASADITFKFVGTPYEGAKMDYTVTPVKGVALTQLGDSDRFMFNYNGIDKYEETGAAIVIGTIEVSGYGKYYLGTDATVTTNAVYATEIRDNIVEGFDAAGKLVVNADMDENDQMVGEVNDVEIVVPTRELMINITFPNAVENKPCEYQQMTVKVFGGDLDEALVIGLGETPSIPDVLSIYKDKTDCEVEVVFENGAYEIEIDELLTLSNAYTVEVSGAGYRTARYTVTMTEDKTLNFWNNVKDNAINVEEGKDSSAKNVTFLAGDIVKDNDINIYDLSAVVSYFGEEGLGVDKRPEYAKYDLNRDGKIDSKDVAYVLVSWGK